jgi:hypothetical protein
VVAFFAIQTQILDMLIVREDSLLQQWQSLFVSYRPSSLLNSLRGPWYRLSALFIRPGIQL